MTVPTGTITEVVSWVDGDPGRAQEALDAELASDSPRSTLIAQLEAIAQKEATAVTETETTEANGTEEEREFVDPPVPDVVLLPNNNDTTVSVIHRRDADVDVPDGVDLRPDDPDDMEATVEAEQVEYFQLGGSPNGVVFSFNGVHYALLPQMAAAFKAAFDKAIAGLAL